jgi:hypothetical protein
VLKGKGRGKKGRKWREKSGEGGLKRKRSNGRTDMKETGK